MGNDIQPTRVTFNIKDTNNKFSILTTDKTFINSIITVKNDTITSKDIPKLQEVAKRSGDLGVIENSDLSPEEKLTLATQRKFGKPYELSLSPDKKYLQVKVKKTKWYYPNPQLKTIKSDFGIPDNILVTQNGIPHNNEALIKKRAEQGSSANDKNTDYDNAELEAGDTINLPINMVNLSDKPQGFWKRPWS